MRKLLFVCAYLVLFVASTLAQDNSIVVSGNFTKFSVDVVDIVDEYAQGFGVQGTYRILGAKGKANGLRVRAVADFQRNNIEVFENYFDGMKFVDIYRDVNTYSAGAGLGYKFGPVEPFANYLLGAEKKHETLGWELARTVQTGARIYVGPVVIEPFRAQFKGNGTKPLGFFGYSVGVGFHFGDGHKYKPVPPETTPTPTKRVAP